MSQHTEQAASEEVATEREAGRSPAERIRPRRGECGPTAPSAAAATRMTHPRSLEGRPHPHPEAGRRSRAVRPWSAGCCSSVCTSPSVSTPGLSSAPRSCCTLRAAGTHAPGRCCAHHAPPVGAPCTPAIVACVARRRVSQHGEQVDAHGVRLCFSNHAEHGAPGGRLPWHNCLGAAPHAPLPAAPPARQRCSPRGPCLAPWRRQQRRAAACAVLTAADRGRAVVVAPAPTRAPLQAGGLLTPLTCARPGVAHTDPYILHTGRAGATHCLGWRTLMWSPCRAALHARGAGALYRVCAWGGACW